MGTRSSKADRIVREIIVCLFFVIGIVGLVYSIKCVEAQHIYVKTKYGVSCPGFVTGPEKVGQNLFDSHDLANSKYPHNYYLHSYVAKELVSYTKESIANKTITFEEFTILARKALFYARLAVQTNPYDDESRLVYQDALVLNGKIDEAVAYWESIVDLEYWNKRHHNIMAELYLMSSSPDSYSLAVNELPHITDKKLRDKLLIYKKMLDK
ncbi:MAG: hypothetical protein J6V41_07925 [Kiritimatiellae bacterium]|nr:hypothetical protein [Kiritimatiellia bacterium]